MPHWKIEKHDGILETGLVGELPDSMSEREVEEVLRRLVCIRLNEEEVLASSLDARHPNRRVLLDRIGSGPEIQFGDNPFFIARLEN